MSHPTNEVLIVLLEEVALIRACITMCGSVTAITLSRQLFMLMLSKSD